MASNLVHAKRKAALQTKLDLRFATTIVDLHDVVRLAICAEKLCRYNALLKTLGQLGGSLLSFFLSMLKVLEKAISYFWPELSC